MNAFDQLPIRKRVTLGDKGEVILIDARHLSADTNWDPARNIFLVKDGNEIVWQAEAAVQSHGAVGYSDVYLGKDGQLLAYSSNGVEYVIEESTGRILGKELIR
jgi:hypothetical protein